MDIQDPQTSYLIRWLSTRIGTIPRRQDFLPTIAV